MSTHYRIELFAPLASAKILGAVNAPAGESDASGCFIVSVPDGVRVENPADLPDLLTKKTAGQLAVSGYSNVAALNTTDGAAYTDSLVFYTAMIGSRGTFCLPPSIGSVYCIDVALTGPAVASGVLKWEEFSYYNSDNRLSTFTRLHQEATTPALTATVSTNGGSNYSSATYGTTVNIPVLEQGNTLKVRFQNTTGQRIYLAGFTFFY